VRRNHETVGPIIAKAPRGVKLTAGSGVGIMPTIFPIDGFALSSTRQRSEGSVFRCLKDALTLAPTITPPA